ncbi:MAG: class I SAM-dependent DNA methyltransferase, partial [Gallionella sp.]|nr:class I SAM-dependent DNA methyltransferase [Gallionella sp.]
KDADGNMRSHHKSFLDRWWQLSWARADMVSELRVLPRYLVCSRVTKRPIFTFVSSSIYPGDALQVFALDDDYSFGVLQSTAHLQWFSAKCSKMKSDYRYTPESVFDTFPWPQAPSAKDVVAVANAGKEVRRVRREAGLSLRELYRTLELPGKNPLRDAHKTLDEAVLTAYGFSGKKDLLTQLLHLNQVVSSQITSGKDAVPPGIPPTFTNVALLNSLDCLN